jgi:hypothetical protein
MVTVALQQVTSPYARRNAGISLHHPITMELVKRFVKGDKLAAIEREIGSDRVHVWGSKAERLHQYLKMLSGPCVVAFRRDSFVYRVAQIREWVVDPELALRLWGRDADGETWMLIYFLRDVKEVRIPAREINTLIGRQPRDHWQGLFAVISPATDQVLELIRERLGLGRKPGPS